MDHHSLLLSYPWFLGSVAAEPDADCYVRGRRDGEPARAAVGRGRPRLGQQQGEGQLAQAQITQILTKVILKKY